MSSIKASVWCYNHHKPEQFSLSPDDIESVVLYVDGYQDIQGSSGLVHLEFNKEKGLMLYIWANPEQEDPSHEICLEAMRIHGT